MDDIVKLTLLKRLDEAFLSSANIEAKHFSC